MGLLHSWARALGGKVVGKNVRCPGPGHGSRDDSLAVMADDEGYPVVYSFAGDDWKTCDDYVRSRIGLEVYKPNGDRREPLIDRFPNDAKHVLEPPSNADLYEEINRQIDEAVAIRVATKNAPPSTLSTFSVASFVGKDIPVREWLVPEVIPANQVTILSGNGGDGKSLLALQLGISVVTETGWIGYMPELGTVLYLSAEDDPDEVHRRVAAIVDGRMDLPLDGMGGFNIIDLSAADAVLAAPKGRNGVLETTPLFEQIKVKVRELRPSLLVIDALADVYGGDENNRGQVRQFISLFRKLAIENRVTVLMISHPSLIGMSSGSGLSGSTGWNNSVRSRLYLEPAVGDDGEPNPFLRKLTVMKANYAAKGSSIGLQWDRGRFVLPGGLGSVERAASEANDDARFLDLLRAATGQGRRVSPNQSSTWAPTVFAAMPEAGGISVAKLRASMERLFRDKKIVVNEIGPPSKRRCVIIEI